MAKDVNAYSEDGSDKVNGTLNNLAEEEQASLDSLLFDGEDGDFAKETPEEAAMYEAFFAEYKDTIAKALATSKDSSAEEAEVDDSEFLISLPVSKDKKAKSENPDEWREEITLAPEKYEDLSEEAEIFHDTIEEAEPDFNLGQTVEKKSDKFQISFSFNGEENVEEVEEEPVKEEKYDPEKPRVIDWAFDFVELFVFTLAAVMILTAFVFKHSIVDGDSMKNTLNHGEHLIISDLFYTPERGDIVVFEDYSTDLNKAVVKRVIGLPGETVKITLTNDGRFAVYINGELLEEDYVYYDDKFYSRAIGEWVVGENEIFVMGDHRNNSADSRYEEIGTISVDAVLGKVILRFYPFDKFGTVK